MDASVGDGPDGLLSAVLDAGESLYAATGALVDHDGGVRVERARDAFRTVANAAREREHPVRIDAAERTTVRLAPPHHGEVVAVEPGDGTVAVARDAFLAASADATLGTDRVGDAPARGSGLFLRTVAGDGERPSRAFLAGRGRVERVVLDEGETRVVAAGHVVGFEDRTRVAVTRLGPTEDAGTACEFRGPGACWVQTRRRAGRSPK